MKGDVSYHLLREALREFVRACAKSPGALTAEMHRAYLRAGELLRAIDQKEGKT